MSKHLARMSNEGHQLTYNFAMKLKVTQIFQILKYRLPTHFNYPVTRISKLI